MNYLSRLALNRDPPDLCLLSSWYELHARHERLLPCCNFYFVGASWELGKTEWGKLEIEKELKGLVGVTPSDCPACQEGSHILRLFWYLWYRNDFLWMNSLLEGFLNFINVSLCLYDFFLPRLDLSWGFCCENFLLWWNSFALLLSWNTLACILLLPRWLPTLLQAFRGWFYN
jgi:hypothetical protein